MTGLSIYSVVEGVRVAKNSVVLPSLYQLEASEMNTIAGPGIATTVLWDLPLSMSLFGLVLAASLATLFLDRTCLFSLVK